MSVAVISLAALLVALSMGNNWGDLTASSSAAEQANAYGANTTNNDYQVTDDNTFVITDYSELNYDDMVIWISPHLLLGKLVTAGKLP